MSQNEKPIRFTRKQREAAQLKAEGKTLAEIAAALTKSYGRVITREAVKQRLQRARRANAERYAGCLNAGRPAHKQLRVRPMSISAADQV